ncbi:MAG: hypothetical protein R3325_03695 [Thermoanaerobaculia bacterium]|nr:hypothetical protein [Thermoanaerobaculia bacterium]
MNSPDPLTALARHPLTPALLRAAAGRSLHLVGGVLRDALLGLPPHDFDIVVAGGGEEVAGRLARELPARLVRLGGERFAAWRLVAESFQVDLWDRGDADLASDLARRDFTVNSLALEPRTAEVSDPHGGRGDAERRRLRATTPLSLASDPLRILRMARFAGPPWRLRPDPDTVALARRAREGLDAVPSERLREEIDRVLGAEDARPGVELLGRLGLLEWLAGVPPAPERAAGARAAVGRLERALALLGRTGAAPGPAARVSARFAVLAAAAGGPPEELVDRVRRARRRGVLSRARAAVAERLLAAGAPPGDAVARRRFLHAAGDLWGLALCVAAARAGEVESVADRLRRLDELARAEGAAIFDPPPLLDGHEIQRRLGLPPGPELGRLADLLRQAQVEGRVADRDEALELLRAAARRR